MTEIASFIEGSLYAYTGSHTASGQPVAYVMSESFTPSRQWQSEAMVDGTYRHHLAGVRADFSISVKYLIGSTLPALFDASTALHLKFLQNVPGVGSAGYMAYTAHLTNAPLAAAEFGIFTQAFNGYCHSWSAF